MKNCTETSSNNIQGLSLALHILGYMLVKWFEFAPLLFPYDYQDSPFLQILFCVLTIYFLVQYILVHYLSRDLKCLRLHHLKLLIVNLCISLFSVLIFIRLTRNEVYDSIHLMRYIFGYEGISVATLFASTIVAIIRSKRRTGDGLA